jgi:uncharacterized protein (TIGR00730 family)
MAEKIITVFGTSQAAAGDGTFELALELGQVLAQAGFVVANGGYGGTMLACAKGARQAGGEVIGVTCSAFKRGSANEYISTEVLTHSLDERLQKLVDLGDGFVVLPGSTGTLLELAKVWELKNKGFLEKGKPVILLGGFWSPLVDLIASEDTGSSQHVLRADDPIRVRDILESNI